mgnify:CR=1 FL=1
MKKLILAMLALFILGSCTINSISMYYDDGYYSAKQRQNLLAERQAAAQLKQNTLREQNHQQQALAESSLTEVSVEDTESLATSETYTETDAQGNTYITNNYYFDEDNYYDYAYTARLRRFYSGYAYDWSYYDPYFTNQYWYTYNPGCWGVSIYYGYNFWWNDPWYRPYYYTPHYYSHGLHWGWGWETPHFAYHARPHSPSPRPNFAFRRDDFRGSHYHNNFDRNYSYNYGHRTSVKGGVNAVNREVVRTNGGQKRSSAGETKSFTDRYENSMATMINNRSGVQHSISGGGVGNARTTTATNSANIVGNRSSINGNNNVNRVNSTANPQSTTTRSTINNNENRTIVNSNNNVRIVEPTINNNRSKGVDLNANSATIKHDNPTQNQSATINRSGENVRNATTTPSSTNRNTVPTTSNRSSIPSTQGATMRTNPNVSSSKPNTTGVYNNNNNNNRSNVPSNSNRSSNVTSKPSVPTSTSRPSSTPTMRSNTPSSTRPSSSYSSPSTHSSSSYSRPSSSPSSSHASPSYSGGSRSGGGGRH